MIELKSSAEIALMREAGRVVAKALAETRAAVAPGVSLRDLDAIALKVIADAGARSSFLNYHPRFAPSPFPAVICASVNEVVVHGIPDDYQLVEGDLVSIDCGAELGGFHGDAAMTVGVGTISEPDQALIRVTEQALRAGIAAARPSNKLGDIGAAVGRIGRKAGYGIPEDFGGHGIGRQMHEEPSVANDGRPGRGLRMHSGLVIAIEPMFMSGGSDEYAVADDGWALLTVDGDRAAHFEHTVAVTDKGPVVLTLL